MPDSASNKISDSFDTVERPVQPLPTTDHSDWYQIISPYNPKIYKCTGYRDEVYQYFDGSAGLDKDQRFTIDIEYGSMDRDVRPYLYFVGFWSSPRTAVQPEVEIGNPSDVEEAYVRIGKEHLKKKRSMGHGYFLNKRDWRPLNEGVWENFPFGRLRHSEGEEGDVGLEAGHDSFEQYPLDCCASVLITNIRTPLPTPSSVRTKPDQPDWDRFIQWMYRPSIHGIMFIVDSGWCSYDVEHERRKQGGNPYLDKWIIREDLDIC